MYILIQISVEGLVRLIAILDIHVLDSAEVHMNTIPVRPLYYIYSILYSDVCVVCVG